MTIYEKFARIDEIGEEMRVIKLTLEAIRYLQETVNITTASRCMMIAVRIGNRMDVLYAEFQKLKSEIESELDSMGS